MLERKKKFEGHSITHRSPDCTLERLVNLFPSFHEDEAIRVEEEDQVYINKCAYL
jgi:hypothetical protein